MEAIYLEEIQKFVKKDLPDPVCGEDQVVVQIKSVGVCGSDVHYWKNGRIGQFVVEDPMILGHESAGVVTEVGPKVKKLKVGDRVALEPGIPCMQCEHCLTGRYNLCQNIVFFATPPDDGILKQSIAYPEQFTFKIPDEIDDYGLASMAEPISVGVFATRRLKPEMGEKCIIFGSGMIGLTCILAAKKVGVKHITVADVRDDRLEWAMKLGATNVINTLKEDVPDDFYDIGYDASGAEACYKIASKCIKPGGRIVFVGMGPELQKVPVVDYVCREINIVTSFRYGNTYPMALEILAENKDLLKNVITHRLKFNLEDVEKAFKIASEDPTAIKVMIDFD